MSDVVMCLWCNWSGEYREVCPNCSSELGAPPPPAEPPPEAIDYHELSRSARSGVKAMIRLAGQDPDSPDLVDTPGRVVRAFAEMTSGYELSPEEILSTTFDGKYDQMIVLRGITFSSLCEHHLLPFTGSAAVGYIPGDSGVVVGLSKLARLVEAFSRRLQIQERLTAQVVDALDKHLQPKGAGCVVRASHQCMACRGVRKLGAEMVTSALSGVFRSEAVRAEFLSLE